MNRRTGLVLAFAYCVGAISSALLLGHPAYTAHYSPNEVRTEPHPTVEDELAELRSEVERLKEKATDQAHVMVSVDYHFGNLWFAGQHANWPLAEFYWNETRSHLRCQLTGRSKGNLRKFKVSRIMLRELALAGKIPGLKKASW